MKLKIFRMDYHSFIDVITNSSSELFVSSNGKLIEAIKQFITDKELSDSKNVIYTKKFKDHYEENDLEEMKENNLERYNKMYGGLKDDDELLFFYYDSENVYDDIFNLLDKLNFKSVWE